MGDKGQSSEDPKLADLRKEHGKLVELSFEGRVAFAFRRPNLDEWEESQDKLRTGKPGPAFRELAQRTLVYGELSALQALFQSRPMVPAMVSDEISDLAREGVEITVKKG